jgi:hypothetical protein
MHYYSEGSTTSECKNINTVKGKTVVIQDLLAKGHLTIGETAAVLRCNKITVGVAASESGILTKTLELGGESTTISTAGGGGTLKLGSADSSNHVNMTSTNNVLITSGTGDSDYIILNGKVKLKNDIKSDGDVNISAAGGKSINL